jgi:hypothetical protein
LVSSLAYPNLLGTKGYAVVVVVVTIMAYRLKESRKQFHLLKKHYRSRETNYLTTISLNKYAFLVMHVIV